MRVYNEVNLNNLEVKLHNIVLTHTSNLDYEMERIMLLEGIVGLKEYDEYLLLEGFHCSCYDFDDSKWEAMVYDKKELLSLANAEYNKNNQFWKMVKSYFNEGEN
jgi:hypothetical protein